MCGELVHIRFDVQPLAVQKLCDRAAELGVDDPMVRPGGDGRETSADLVLSLRPGLEAAQSLSDAVVDSLVVTRLEVQAVKVREATPIAPVERVAAAKADRRTL